MRIGAGLLVVLAMCGVGCAGAVTPALRGEYAVVLPLLGAPLTPSHAVNLSGGILSSGTGAQGGAAVDMRFVVAGDLFRAEAGASVLGFLSPEDRRLPFLISEAGLGLIGLSGVKERPFPRGSADNSVDFLNPHAGLALGVPLGRGVALSLGVSLQYVFRAVGRSDRKDLLLLAISLGFGILDPRFGPDESVAGFLMKKR